MRSHNRTNGIAGWMLALCLTTHLAAQTQLDLATQSKRVDFSAAASTRPARVGTSLPSTCSIGDLFFKSNAPAGQNLYGCTAANAWTILSGALTWSEPNAPPTNDMRVVKASATQLTIGDTCSPADPCNIRIGSFVLPVTAPMAASITAGGGNGLARIYLTEAGVPLVDHSVSAGLTVSCAGGCLTQQTVAPEYPLNAIPLAEVLITSGTWNTVTDRRSLLHNRALVAGQGILVNEVAGVATVEIDSADVARQGGVNDWTGTNDFSASTELRLVTDAGVPEAALCNTAVHVGRVYVRSDAGTPNASVYACGNTGASVFAWELLSPGADDPLRRDAVTIVEEFLPNAAPGWPTVGTVTYPPGGRDHPGVLRLESAATVDAAASVAHDAASWASALDEAYWEAVFIFRIGELSTEHQFRAGFADGRTGLPSNGIWARLSNSTACAANNNSDSVWQFESRAADVSTTVSSGVSAASDDWVALRLRATANGEVRMSIGRNGGEYSAEQAITSNLPSGALFPIFQAVTCAGAARSIAADSFAFRRRGISR